MIKNEARVLGIDDAPFDKFSDKSTMVIAVFFRGGHYLDGVLSTTVTVDGHDSTEKIIEMVNNSKFKPQLQAIMLDGIAVGGFNIIDVVELSKKTELPVMVIMRDYPELEEIKSALIKLHKEEKLELLNKAGEIHKVGDIHIQISGLLLEKAKELLKITCIHSFIPEPIRVAHLVASGITKGESKGKA